MILDGPEQKALEGVTAHGPYRQVSPHDEVNRAGPPPRAVEHVYQRGTEASVAERSQQYQLRGRACRRCPPCQPQELLAAYGECDEGQHLHVPRSVGAREDRRESEPDEAIV